MNDSEYVYVCVSAYDCMCMDSYLTVSDQCEPQWRIQDLRKGVSKFVEKAHVAAV